MSRRKKRLVKTTSKKIMDIESEYIQLLKKKVNSLQNWDFQKKIYKMKILNLKKENKILKKKLKRQRHKDGGVSCWHFFSHAILLKKILPMKQEVDLEESSEFLDDSLGESSFTFSDDEKYSSTESLDVNTLDNSTDPNGETIDTEKNKCLLPAIGGITAAKVGAVTAAGLLF